MYKSLGGFSWTGIFKESVVLQHECAADAELAPIPAESNVETEFNIMESAQSLQASFASLKNVKAFNPYFSSFLLKIFELFQVFSTEVYKGFLGFATWWSYFTLFATSSLGIVYQSYFNKT